VTASAMNAEQLHSAFEVFNQHSTQLENSYRELRDRLESLTAELGEARSARVHELMQKERLSHRLALLLETLPGAILVIDGEGVIREQNSRALALFGEPLNGCAWADIVRREAGDGACEDGNIELKDGRWLSLSRQALQHEPGEILLLSDVTESRRMAELRQRSERLSAIGEMTAEFAHQVRTPLASAMLYMAQLKPADPGQEKVVQKITDRLNDLGRMANDMLSFASGGKRAEEIVDVTALLGDIRQTVVPQLADGSTLELVIDGSDMRCSEREQPPFRFAANADALKGALINLIINADQASDGAARIQLGAWQDDESVYFTVTDDGPGIPGDALPRLFEAFFTTRPQGTGLGLAVVRAVARAHGGDVRVETLKQGSRFTLHLPDVIDSLKGGGV